MAENYDLIFGQSASSQYAWSDSDYQNGWQTVGSTPPTAEQFDALQRKSDTKAKDLNDRLSPLETKAEADGRQAATSYTAGTMLTVDGLPNGWLLECIASGTSGTDAITLPDNLIDGLTIIDGSVMWALRKVATYGDLGYRQPSTAYSVGDVVYVKGAGAKYRLACVTAGTTSADELAIPSGAKAGDSITDGTAIWKVEEIEGMITAIESDGGLVTLTRVDGSTEQLQIVANNAGAHNAVYRGKDLTAYFDSGEMSKAITAGTFKDIYPGDYITKSVTVNGTTYSDVKWIVGDLDYFLGHGDTSILTQHHVLMFPDTCLGNSYMNPTHTTEGAYMGSYMYTTMIPLVNAGIQAAFGASHVVSYREYMSKLINATMACASGNGWTGSTYWGSGEWADVLSNLFTENMVYGANIFSSSPQDVCNGCRQVAAFRHDSSIYIGGTKRETWWLRAVANSDSFAAVHGDGLANCNGASDVVGVRPYFLLA